MTPLETISARLTNSLTGLTFAPPVACVYNPLVYAGQPHRRYLVLYGGGRREVLLVGMNPGPFGMAQTGVPFGDVGMVRDWLGICEPVGQPPEVHPKRPIQGFDCSRSEVSGQRLWGWARDTFGTPDRFFARFFVWNYCPLCFMEDSGRNRTPDKLPAAERDALFVACDEALREVAAHLAPAHVVGIGRFAHDRARSALADTGAAVAAIPHPSPASPAANRGWAQLATAALESAGIALP